MKIKKTPPRKLSPPSRPVRELIEKLQNAKEDELADILDAIKEWPFPRGDLYHWIGVLNRFDTILETTCNEHITRTTKDKRLVLGVLRFSRFLLENCTNRNQYSSYEHLDTLLRTSDWDILEADLRLLLRPAQRMSNQRALRTNFTISTDQIMALAHGWGSQNHDINLRSIALDDSDLPDITSTMSFQFYRTADEVTKDPRTASTNATSSQEPESSSVRPTSNGQSEGMILVPLNDIANSSESEPRLVHRLIDEYQVSTRAQFELIQKIRVALAWRHPQKRRQLLVIRLLAIAIMAHVVSESQAQSSVFMYEPDLISQIADVIHPESKVPLDVQTAALYALDGLARHRSKTSEILTSLNASANHGTLLYLLRKVATSIQEDNDEYPQDFLDALFAFIAYIIQTQTGGQMVMAAGIIPTLLSMIEAPSNKHVRDVTRVVSMLDSLVYGFSNSFSAFCNARGLDILVKRLEVETEYCEKFAAEQATAMDTSEEHTVAPAAQQPVVPHERISLLKAMHKFILHMMQASGTADGLRNLIDTTLPATLRRVISNAQVFGPSVYALAVNTMATFIHNEPTSLPILQEAGLSQAFLKSVKADIPAHVDVASAIPNAFGAICLNSQGLEAFNEEKPIGDFFRIFTSKEHVRSLNEGDAAPLLGAAIDELIRHHPSLKGDVYDAVINMLKSLNEMGKIENRRPDDIDCALAREGDKETDSKVDRMSPSNDEQDPTTASRNSDRKLKSNDFKDSTFVQHIEVCGRFLEGLLQNSSHAKEFLKQGGVSLILDLYQSPLLPYDFASTLPFNALGHLLRTLAEVNSVLVVHEIIHRLSNEFKRKNRLLEEETQASVVMDIITTEDDEAKYAVANESFRHLITLWSYIYLWDATCNMPIFSHGKAGLPVLQEVLAPSSDDILGKIGHLQRVAFFESALLQKLVPKEWKTAASQSSTTSTDQSVQSDIVTSPADQSMSRQANVKSVSQWKNFQYYKHLLFHINKGISPLFANILRMAITRRSVDSNLRRQGYRVAEVIGALMKDHLTWRRPKLLGDSAPYYAYLALSVGCITTTMLDDRSAAGLVTTLAVGFDRRGGLLELRNIFTNLLENALPYSQINDPDTAKDVKDTQARLYTAIGLALQGFSYMCSNGAVLDSPYTTIITSKDKDRKSENFFEPHEWLVDVRGRVFETILACWKSKQILTLPPPIIKQLLKAMNIIMKGDGEAPHRSETLGALGNIPSLFSAIRTPPVAPDAQGIQTLVEMGFAREAAETAMIRCSNQVPRAIDYLFSHPQLPMTSRGESSRAAATTSEEAEAEESENNEGGSNITGEQASSADAQAIANESLDPNSTGNTDTNVDSTSAMAVDVQLENNGQATDAQTTDSTMQVVEDKPDEAEQSERHNADSAIDEVTQQRERLKELRDDSWKLCAQLTPMILDVAGNLVFEVRDLLLIMAKTYGKEVFAALLEEIEEIRKGLSSAQEDKRLSTRTRLLAILLQDPNAHSQLVEMSQEILPALRSMISAVSDGAEDEEIPSWLAPILLVIEAFLAEKDQPVAEDLITESDQFENPNVSKDAVARQGAKEDPEHEAFIFDMLNCCQKLLTRRKCTRDQLHAILRMLVRLTRSFTIAKEFFTNGGLNLLLAGARSEEPGFQGQQAFIIILMRHMIERSAVLRKTMEKEISAWFTHPRPRLVDVNTYIRNNAYIALRNPEKFVAATKDMCKLSHYDTTGSRPQQITLVKNEKASTSSDSTAGEESTSRAETVESSSSTEDVELTTTVLHCIIGELLDHRLSDADVARFIADLKASEKERADTTTPSANDAKESDPSSKQVTEAKNALSNNVIYTNFLLQCLVELLTSYPSCKTEIISFNRKGSNTSQVKSKYVFLNYLLNDLLPYGGVTPNEELVRKKFGLSNWAASVLVAICSAADDEKDMTDDSDMTSGRKQVLESIIRAIKDASNSTEGINARYGKLFALGDLCHRLLNARQNSPTVQRIKTTDEMSSRIAKLMLEKHFVSVLTNALSEIDVNYPHARTVINALLRPLEQLTKVAIRLARPTDTNKEERRRESRLQQVYGDSDDIESDAEDAPDLYRNSALGMYEGNLEQENDAMDTSEEEEIYEEDDYADETGSDLSDLSDEEGIEEGDIDEEIDVIMHPHDYHDEDEDDEDEDGSDQDDEDEDEEDLLEDTGVIEDEDGSDDDQEMTWEIADMDEEDDDDDNNDLVPLSVDIGDDLVSMSPALHHHFDDGDGHVEMIIEDAEDEDDGESDTDDANEIDEHDGDDADDYEDDVLDDRRSLPFNFDGNLGDEGWVLGNRSFVNLGGRRHARIMPSRHTMFEITSPSGNFDFIGDGADETRFSSLLEDADNLDTLSSRFGRPNISTSDDVTTHPLLAGQDGPSENASMQNRARGIPSASGDVRTLEDLIGGSAIQLLESILSRHSRPSRAGNHATGYRLELNTANGGVLGSVDIPSLLAARRPGATASTARNRSADMKDPLATIQEFSPMTTAERWHQEARMLFGTNMADKAFKLSNAILNALAPAAIAEEKRRKEQEEKARAERKAKEEEERRKQEEEAKRRRQEEEEAAAKKAEEDAAMTSEEQQGVPETSEGHGEGSQSRQANNPDMTVMVNGVPIDLTGSGIDPTFLEALPEDLRQEVISQHVRERTSQPSTNDDANISPEFLEALPPDIRQEVLQQEAMERERRNRQSRNETADSLGPSDLDPASFLATLDPMLRETVLMEQDDSFLVTLPPALVAEANSIRDRPSHRVQIGRPRPSHALQSNTSSTAKKANPNKDSVQLLDRPQLASLLRLLFLPQAISKTMLNKLLLNLSENSKTRADLIALLLSVLQDGSVDLAAVDKNFAQMSLRPKPSLKAHSKGKMSSGSNLQVSAMSENVPNLITQRCIEALTYIVTYNEQAVQFFLSEHENLSGLKRNITKKGKGKDRGPSSSKYAVVVLLSLLDRPVFLQNTHIMDQLMHLIATVCRPLSSLNKTEAVNGKANSKPNDATDNETPAPAPAPGDDGVQDEAKAEDGNNQGKSTEQNTKETASESTPNPPNIPEHYLRLVVDVLTAGECSSKTFQYTLTVIQHLCALPEAKNVITNALRKSAQDLGNAILIDLKELAPMIESATSGADLQGSTLSRFSQSSSQQAKLLRVLKTLDYIYSRKQQATQPTASPAEPVEPAEPAERAALTPGAITTGEEKPTTYVLTEDERNVLKIYDSLSFQPLWKMLGYSLGLVHDKRDMIHVATVLLPLIESFMVVSRYVGINGAQSKEKGKEKYDAEDSTTDTTSDDLFFTFTEEHRKILNTMVRNNPSLMSGSFSLLVRNPKMLEFDNKRNYFVQQLHKRVNNREHYGSLQLNVRRQYVFEDSYHQLQGRTGDEIKYGKLNVHFYDEEGVDAGGVTREWFSVLARQMFDPNYALFKTSAADKLTYQPNRASWVNPDHLSFFKFVGRVIGKAIYDGKLLDAYFTRSFYKHILGRPVDYRDIEAIDPAYFKSLDWMLENSIQDVMELTFSMETDDFGTQKTIDLKPNGRNIEVTDENKHEYVRLVTEQKLTVAIKDQIRAFLEGFHDVIPPHLISIFNEQELELLISGLPDIDIDDWKNNTEYQGYTASSPQVQWFWRAVRSFDQEERAKLLQFATGTSKVPLEGFNRLQGSSGVQKFQIHKDYSSNNRLPSAHTCFNQVDLPQYDSYESLRSQLLTAIQECATGFGFG